MKSKSKNLIEATKYLYHHDSNKTNVAKLFQVDRHSLPVKDYEKYIYLYKDRYCWLSEEELTIIRYWIDNPNLTFLDIRQKFNKPENPRTLKQWLNIYGYSSDRHYQVNYNREKFKSIATEDEAYWLGFILADGYLDEKRNTLQIKLAKKDEDHLKKFISFLGCNDYDSRIKECVGGAYSRDSPCCVVKICSKDIVINLKQYGIFQKKSGIETPYHFIDEKLIKPYIRGIFDGDGWIKSTDEFGFGFCGSYAVLSYIKEMISKYSVDMDKVSIRHEGKIYNLSTGGRNKTIEFFDWLYKDATIFLNRKYEIYIQKKQQIAI